MKFWLVTRIDWRIISKIISTILVLCDHPCPHGDDMRWLVANGCWSLLGVLQALPWAARAPKSCWSPRASSRARTNWRPLSGVNGWTFPGNFLGWLCFVVYVYLFFCENPRVDIECLSCCSCRWLLIVVVVLVTCSCCWPCWLVFEWRFCSQIGSQAWSVASPTMLWIHNKWLPMMPSLLHASPPMVWLLGQRSKMVKIGGPTLRNPGVVGNLCVFVGARARFFTWVPGSGGAGKSRFF